MRITAPAFADGAQIPVRYTCDGEDISPALDFDDLPAGATSLALIVIDPDAPRGEFVHWLLWNLPATTRTLPAAIDAAGRGAPAGVLQGTTDFGRPGYGGPCPPDGTHRYRFTVYALDRAIDVAAGARRDALAEALTPHVLAQATLTGRYTRSKRG